MRAWRPCLNPAIAALEARIAELDIRRTDALATAKRAESDIATLRRSVDILNDKPEQPVVAKGRAPTTLGLPVGVEATRFRPALLEALRDAVSPLSTAETTAIVLDRLGVPESTSPRAKLSVAANKMLTRYAERGILRRIRREGECLRWEVAR